MPQARPMRVLFLCTGNSCRSQMAEGLARRYAGDRLEVYSAGTAPEPIRRETVEVMRELGLDISAQRSKSLAEVPSEVEVVVTLCDHAAETCPLFPGSPRRLHWSLPDPAGSQGSPEEVREAYRAVRDRLDVLVKALIVELIGVVS